MQPLQAGVDVGAVHVDQHTRPLGGGLHDPGQVDAFAHLVAVRGPDDVAEHDRGDRQHAENGRRDAVSGKDLRRLRVRARKGRGRTRRQSRQALPASWRPVARFARRRTWPDRRTQKKMEGWRGDCRGHSIGRRPELCRRERPPPRRPFRPCQRPLADRIRDSTGPGDRRRIPPPVRPGRRAGARPDRRASEQGASAGTDAATHRRPLRQLPRRGSRRTQGPATTARRAGDYRQLCRPRRAWPP